MAPGTTSLGPSSSTYLTTYKGMLPHMSYKLVQWALERAQILRNGRGNNVAAHLNLIARCEMQRTEDGSHFLSSADMEFRTGLSRTTIRETNKALEEAGLIVKVGQTRDGIDVYRIDTSCVRSDDELLTVRAKREKSRRGTNIAPGSDAGPGPESTPLTGPEHDPPGLDSAALGVEHRTQTVPSNYPVEEPSNNDATASDDVLFKATPRSSSGKNDGEHPDFQRFWELYRSCNKRNGFAADKIGSRKPASRAFAKAVKDGASTEAIIGAVDAYMESEKPKRGYPRHASTWLNQRGWEDEYAPFVPQSGAVARLLMPERGAYPDDPFAA